MVKKLTLLFSLLFLCLLLTGCSTAGPFVTGISSDGRGGLIIEKSRVKLNPWTDGLETCETTTSTIQLSNPDTRPAETK